MNDISRRKNRRSIRLKNYDYTQSGYYFLTICVHQRECLFGEIVEGNMITNDVGEIVQQTWDHLPNRFPTVAVDSFVVMPNHVHGIIIIKSNADRGVGAALAPPALGDIVRAFKSISAVQGNRILGRSGRPLWQRNYYERVIRNDDELTRAREYILNNPAKWEMDAENPNQPQN
ncbi:transposase [Candidatus Poribacteria bacterium]|nr:transposase [Candidatus Poribacteria bacterium]